MTTHPSPEEIIQSLEYFTRCTQEEVNRGFGMNSQVLPLLNKSMDAAGLIDETKLTKKELRIIAEAALGKLQSSVMRAQVAEAVGDGYLDNLFVVQE